MEDAVKDAILVERAEPYLKHLIEITVASQETNRPLFSILDEPVLYRLFTKWVGEGLKEAQMAKDAMHKAHDEASSLGK